MARFAMAEDLEQWRAGRRRRAKRRKAGKSPKGRGVRRELRKEARQEARQEARAPAGGPAGSPLAVAEPLDPRRRKHGHGRRGHDAIRGEDEDEETLHEAGLEDGELEADTDELAEPAELDDDLGEEPKKARHKPGARVRDALQRDWQKPMDLGQRMRIQTRAGTRAAIVEVKPGLFVIAEVPVESVEFGFGPMLLAPALMKTLGRALQGRRSAGGAGRAHRPELSTESRRQLPGPTRDQDEDGDDETEGLAPWLDPDIAAELGCPVRVRRGRETP